MAETKYTILESWPALREDLSRFLSDTDAWVISELKKARDAKNWGMVDRIIDVMDFVHNLNHGH
jgi:hypothetical protein